LYEQNSLIEIRYYSMDPTQQSIISGINGPANDLGVHSYAYLLNGAMIAPALSRGMASSTLLISSSEFVFPTPMSTFYTSSFTSLGGATQTPLTNAHAVPSSNDGIVTIRLGFLFKFFDREYQSINLAADGTIQFETTTIDISPDAMPMGNSALTPYLAYFYTDLFPNYAGSRQYALQGNYPNRIFTLRLINVPYYSGRFDTPAPTVSLDVKLYENDGRIEILYFGVSAYPSQTLVIGVEGPPYLRSDWSFDYTAPHNAVAIDSIVASSLQGQQLVFNPVVPQSPPRFLKPVSYSLN
jgi:hypothetical protein